MKKTIIGGFIAGILMLAGITTATATTTDVDPCANYQFAGSLEIEGTPNGRICADVNYDKNEVMAIKGFNYKGKLVFSLNNSLAFKKNHYGALFFGGNSEEYWVSGEVPAKDQEGTVYARIYKNGSQIMQGWADTNPDFGTHMEQYKPEIVEDNQNDFGTVVIALGDLGDLDCFVILESGNKITVKKRGLPTGEYVLAELCNITSPNDPIVDITYKLLTPAIPDYVIAENAHGYLDAMQRMSEFRTSLPDDIPFFNIRGDVNGMTAVELLHNSSFSMPVLSDSNAPMVFWGFGDTDADTDSIHFGLDIRPMERITVGIAMSESSSVTSGFESGMTVFQPYVMVGNVRASIGYGTGEIDYRNRQYDSTMHMATITGKHVLHDHENARYGKFSISMEGNAYFASQQVANTSVTVKDLNAALRFSHEKAISNISLRSAMNFSTDGFTADSKVGYQLNMFDRYLTVLPYVATELIGSGISNFAVGVDMEATGRKFNLSIIEKASEQEIRMMFQGRISW